MGAPLLMVRPARFISQAFEVHLHCGSEGYKVSRKTSKNLQITRFGPTGSAVMEDPVTVEAPLTVILDGREFITTLCTPEKLDHLALGFLRSEGIIHSMEDISLLRVKEEEGLVEIELAGTAAAMAGKLHGRRTLTSGCGRGGTFYNALDSLGCKPLKSALRVSAEHLLSLVRHLQERALLFQATGGVHSAALADREGILYFCEDIGRHNAVDKIAGLCLLDEVPTADKIIVTSGRLSSEMLIKAARLGVPILVSRSAPTTLSVTMAEELQITLAGFTRGRRFNLYSHPWRIDGLDGGQ